MEAVSAWIINIYIYLHACIPVSFDWSKISGYGFNGAADRTISGLFDAASCKQACLEELEFECKSVTYAARGDGHCSLFMTTWKDSTDFAQVHTQYDYYDYAAYANFQPGKELVQNIIIWI